MTDKAADAEKPNGSLTAELERLQSGGGEARDADGFYNYLTGIPTSVSPADRVKRDIVFD